MPDTDDNETKSPSTGTDEIQSEVADSDTPPRSTAATGSEPDGENEQNATPDTAKDGKDARDGNGDANRDTDGTDGEWVKPIVHDRPQQLCRGLCHGALKPAGCANGAQTGQCLFVIQGVPPYSWLTSSLNFLPRSIKFLKWSKAAQAGDNTTTSPALALSRASPTAAARSSAITISMPLFG